MTNIKHKNFIRLLFLSFLIFFLNVSCRNNPGNIEPNNPCDGSGTIINPAELILKKLGGKVRIDSSFKDKNGNDIVFFYFYQPLDHNDASKGTIEQYCALHYKGKGNITVLLTNGYSIFDEKYYRMEDIAEIYNANYIEVEHRYYKKSGINLPKPYEGDYWNYNTAEQATADLHDIVTALDRKSVV